MALVNCVECGHAVSTEAASCPGCGSLKFAQRTPPREQEKTKSQALLVTAGAGVVVVSLMTLVLSSHGESATTRAKVAAAVEASKTPEQRAAEAAAKAKKEADFQFAVVAARALKGSLKNPASFELVSAILVDGGGPLCLEYRGTNSYNAVITERAAIKRDYKLGKWALECTGKTGSDMKSIRHAL